MFSGLSVITFDVEEKRGRNVLKTAPTSQLYMISSTMAGGDTERAWAVLYVMVPHTGPA